MILRNALNKPPGLFSWCSLHFHKDRLLTTLAFSYMWVEFNLSFTYSPQRHRWEKPEPEGISHPGQGSQAGRHFQTKRRGRWHSWKIRLLVWPASASHRDNGITDNCLRGICCCSNTSLIWHTCASHHSLSAFLTHLLDACVDINFSLPDTHGVHTHTHRKFPHTHTHLLAQTIFARGKQQKREGWLSCYFQTYQCSSGAVICVIYESLNVWRAPILQSCCLNVCLIIQQQQLLYVQLH